MKHWNEKAFREHTDTHELTLVEFWAPWCVYCRRIGPAMERIAEQYVDKVTVGLVNIDEEPALSDREQIEMIPTLVLYRDGQALGALVAPESKGTIESFLLAHMEG